MLPRIYTLIIAEKPKAASKIAYALSNGLGKKYTLYNVPYWVFRLNGKWFVVGSAAGHLFTLTTDTYGFPVFDYHWAPTWLVDRSAKYTKPYFLALKKLCTNAIEYINACDYDIEGSVIGYMVIRELGDLRRAYRMKFSTLTPHDLKKAFQNLSKGLDMSMVEAGLCRHELDWIWGINVSRALMFSVRKVSGKRIILSAGRVQSPTLVEVVNTEFSRNTFVPTPLFNINVQVKIGGRIFSLESLNGSFKSKVEAQRVVEYIRKVGKATVEKVEYREERYSPPPPFNLGDLQAEAAKIYGFSPMETQKIAEQLYLDALISYPRTNSQKLPPTIGYGNILKSLSKLSEYARLVNTLFTETRGQLCPHEGPKTDPAHPAIYPTGVLPRKLSDRDAKVYDLIVRRFLATFSSDLKIFSITLYLTVGKYKFRLKFRTIKEKGWLKYYPFVTIEETLEIPVIRKGQKLPIVKVRVTTSYTKFQKTYTKASLLKWMESVNIGTESTRARIIESLFSRGYLKSSKGKIEVTHLGYAVAEILRKYFNDLTDVGLTRRFEEKLNAIREGKISREQVVEESKEFLKTLLEKFKNEEAEKAGIDLAKSLKLIRPDKPCMICGMESVENEENIMLCRNHYEALLNLKEAYGTWVKAFGTLDFHEYLRKVSRLSISGKWVREVANSILEGKIIFQ